MVPWSRRRSDTLGNIQLLCRTCNRRKGNRYVG
ncbi:MAG: HNH endonuclease [Rubrobacter sp.]|nr:HNH endonuclease [Rubrobacter sp.]